MQGAGQVAIVVEVVVEVFGSVVAGKVVVAVIAGKVVVAALEALPQTAIAGLSDWTPIDRLIAVRKTQPVHWLIPCRLATFGFRSPAYPAFR